MEDFERLTLVLSAFAIIISIVVAVYARHATTSDYRAQQQVKYDTAILLSSLRSLMHKGAYSTTTTDSVDISSETIAISNFLTSATGLAYFAWVDEKGARAKKAGKSGEQWRLFFLYLAELSVMTDARAAARRAADVELLFDDLTENDVRQISDFNADLVKSIARLSEYRAENVIVQAFVEESVDTRPELAEFRAKLQFLKSLGIDDPNIDLFLAVTDKNSDVDAVRAALNAGADVTMTDGMLLHKYREQLQGFPGN